MPKLPKSKMTDTRVRSVPVKLELLFRAWNLWREGKSIRSIPIINNIPDPK